MAKVSTVVYKYNTNGFVLIGIYIICLFIAIMHLISMSTGEILFFGAVFLAVPLYVQYGNSEKLRMLIPDERSLIFSGEGIDFGEEHYPVKDIETAAIFLESFTGFEYRIFGAIAPSDKNAYVKANGDGNKISFRFGGEVQDFTFCLTSYAQFCIMRNVINEWIAAGVNVALRQAFDDDFIIQEMEHYQTPSGTSGRDI
jgi:hypothetical protein